MRIILTHFNRKLIGLTILSYTESGYNGYNRSELYEVDCICTSYTYINI